MTNKQEVYVMARLLSKEDENHLVDDDSSDEIFVPAGCSYKKYARRKDAHEKEQEQLRLNMEEVSGTFKMILKGLNRLQSQTPSRTIDEKPMSTNVISKTEENSKRMRREKVFGLENHENYEKVPALVNTITKLATRIDTLNHRLEQANIRLCLCSCCHEHKNCTGGSVRCINIQELAGDREPSEMKSANRGTHQKLKGAVDIYMPDKNLHKDTPRTKCDSKMVEAYELLPTDEPHGSKEQTMHKSNIDRLADNDDENQAAIDINLVNDPKQLDKKNSSGEENSSVAFIRIDSSGLKSLKTDPQEDNRQKRIKEDFKNISAKENVVKQKNANPSRKANPIKYDHVQSKGYTNYSNLEKKEIVKTDDTPNIDSNFIKTELSADKNRNKNGVGTISGPALSSTAKTYPQANASFIVPNHLPKEYWDSVCQETYDKALKIRASRSIGFDTIICLDTSMSVAEYWEDILDFLRNLINEIEIAQPMEGGLMEHIALVTFGHETCALQHFTPNYQEVLTQIFTIYPEGSTPLYWGVDLCRAILLGSAYVPRMRDFTFAPRLLLITDGRPTYKLMTGGTDEVVQYDEDKEKEDVAEQLISISMKIPLFRVYPVSVGNNCDMEFLTAIAHLCGGKVMTLSDWSSVARYGKTMELASKYFGLASLSEDLLVKVLKGTSGLKQEDIEFITTEVTDQLEHSTNEGTTSDEEEVEGFYQFPPVGSRVRRGPHWNRNDEDNAGPGTIIAYSKGKAFSGWLIVEWDKPKKYGRWQFRYRYGAENAYDVKIQKHEGPRVMEHSLIMGVGCEIVRDTLPNGNKLGELLIHRKYIPPGLITLGSHRKSNDDGIEEGTIGMVYRTNIDGPNVAKIRWQNGKRLIYGAEALTSGEIRLRYLEGFQTAFCSQRQLYVAREVSSVL